MDAYEDENCGCHRIEDEIDAEFPDTWNCGAACNEWRERSKELKDNGIEFEEYSDSCYSCTCPACGRTICGWCV